MRDHSTTNNMNKYASKTRSNYWLCSFFLFCKSRVVPLFFIFPIPILSGTKCTNITMFNKTFLLITYCSTYTLLGDDCFRNRDIGLNLFFFFLDIIEHLQWFRVLSTTLRYHSLYYVIITFNYKLNTIINFTNYIQNVNCTCSPTRWLYQ